MENYEILENLVASMNLEVLNKFFLKGQDLIIELSNGTTAKISIKF